MVKIILEKDDIMEVIRDRYEGAELVEGIDDGTAITITVPNFRPVQKVVPEQKEQQITAETPQEVDKKKTHTVVRNLDKREEIRLKNGSIDANKSGLSPDNREETKPGGAMGRKRGRLPMF